MSSRPLMRRLSPPPSRRAFTLVEILVVIAIIVLLAAILFPAFASAREKARSASCASNLRQIGFSIAQYTQDYDEHYPSVYVDDTGHPRDFWDVCQPYIKNHDIFHCPSDFDTDECVAADGCTNKISYGANGGPLWVRGGDGEAFEQGGIYSDGGYPFGTGESVAHVAEPSKFFLAADAYSTFGHFMDTGGYSRNGGQMPPRNSLWRHGNWRNVVYADGHVKMVAWRSGWIDTSEHSFPTMLPRNKADYESYCLNPDKPIANWWLGTQEEQRCGDVAAHVECLVTQWLPE